MTTNIRMLGVCQIAILLAVARVANAANTGIDPINCLAWTENAGWVNAAPTNGGVMVHFDGNTGWLTGLAWSENVGWIKMGDDRGGPYANNSAMDWGVNLDVAGNLSGYAWGENVGWIKFSHAYGDVKIAVTNGNLSGYAWGENIGWLKFGGSSPAYGVRTLAFDAQPHGTPNWWLDHHGVAEIYDAGDGVPAWRKYVMDTNPNIAGDLLRITAVSNAATAMVVTFVPASKQRYYTLLRREDMSAGTWSNVVQQISVPGTGGSKTMQDTNVVPRVGFYTIKASVTP